MFYVLGDSKTICTFRFCNFGSKYLSVSEVTNREEKKQFFYVNF